MAHRHHSPNSMLHGAPSTEWRVNLPSYESAGESPTFVLKGEECYFALYRTAGCLLKFYTRRQIGHEALCLWPSPDVLLPFSVKIFSQLVTGDTESCKRRVTRSGQELWRSYDGDIKPKLDDTLYSITFVFTFEDGSGFISASTVEASGTPGIERPFQRGLEVGAGAPASQKGGNQVPTAPASNRCPVQASSENPCLEALSQDFGKLLEAESDQDVALKCGDRTVGAHKNVLASRSKVFESMLQSDMVEGRTGQVEVKDMDADVFQEFVKYLYTGTLQKLTEDKAKGLYEAGDRYAVPSLMRRCSVFLSETLTVQNACERLALADAHSDSEFKERVIAFILEKKVPLMDDQWRAFSTRCPLVSVEVLNRFCKLHVTA